MLKDKNCGLSVAAILFALFGLVHLIRLAMGFEVTIAHVDVPWWGSVIALTLTWFLAGWLWYLKKV